MVKRVVEKFKKNSDCGGVPERFDRDRSFGSNNNN